MELKEISKIEEYVALKNPEEIKYLLICALIMSIVFPVMIYGLVYWVNINTLKTPWAIFYILYGILIVWNFYLRTNIYNKQLQFLLFNAIFCFVIAVQFIGFYYVFGIESGISRFYLIIGLIGVSIIIAIVCYYRYRVYKGFAKNRSGSPNYAVIMGITLIGSALVKGVLSGVSVNSQIILISSISLFVGCGFAIGTLSIHQYYVAIKYKDQIELFKKPKVKAKKK